MSKGSRIKTEREQGTRKQVNRATEVNRDYRFRTKSVDMKLQESMRPDKWRTETLMQPHGINNRMSTDGRPHYYQKVKCFLNNDGKTIKGKEQKDAVSFETRTIKHAVAI